MGRSSGRVGVMALKRPVPDDVQTWVERTCAAQGVSVKVTDPAVIAAAAVLVGQTRQTGSRRSGSKRFRPGTAGRIVTRSRTEATIAR
jgi:hypothetical protein